MRSNSFKQVLFTCRDLLAKASIPWRQEWRLVRDIWKGRFPESMNQLPLTFLERSFITGLVAVRSASLLHVALLIEPHLSGSAISESYVVFWFLLLTAVLIFHASLTSWFVLALVCYRLADSLNYRLCILFVDRYKKGWGLRSLNRSLVLLFINYAEIVVGFATLYLITQSVGYTTDTPILSRLDSLYFSAITMATIGYGDIRPITPTGKWLSLAEAAAGFALVVLVVGSFLTGMGNIHNLPNEPNKEM